MKSVSHLSCSRCASSPSVSVCFSTVTTDQLYCRMLLEPGCETVCRSVCEQINRPPRLQVDEYRTVSVAFAPSPVINANKLGFVDGRQIISVYLPKHGVRANRYTQSNRQTAPGFPTQGITNHSYRFREP